MPAEISSCVFATLVLDSDSALLSLSRLRLSMTRGFAAVYGHGSADGAGEAFCSRDPIDGGRGRRGLGLSNIISLPDTHLGKNKR